MQVHTFKQTPTGVFAPHVFDDGALHQVAIAPQAGPQLAYCMAPEREVGLAGNRGGGKTQIMLMDALSGVGRGWGANYKMILLRRSQREFTDILTWLVPLIKTVWPTSSFNRLKNIFEWSSGETLELSYYDTEADFSLYQGKSFAVIMWEELTLWPDAKCYLSMFSCLRAGIMGMPRKIRFTTNPSGVGHNWVKHRFHLQGIPVGVCGPCITETVDGVPASRRMIYIGFADNPLLQKTEPHYMRSVEISCEGNPALLRAWRLGDWSIVAGGGFDSIFFDHGKNIYCDRFELPATGKCWMSYDHGSTKPYACLFWWESDGCDITHADGRRRSTRPGDLFLIGEVYGWNGRPNEGTHESIAQITTRIQTYKIERGWRYRDVLTGTWVDYFKRGFADNSIGEEMNEFSVQVEFENPVMINGTKTPGIKWELVTKPPGSRVTGFALVRERLIGCSPRPDSRIREGKGLFVVKEDCPNFVRTIPVLPRSPKNLEDVDSNSEDHIFDSIKYMLQADRSPHISTHRRQIW